MKTFPGNWSTWPHHSREKNTTRISNPYQTFTIARSKSLQILPLLQQNPGKSGPLWQDVTVVGRRGRIMRVSISRKNDISWRTEQQRSRFRSFGQSRCDPALKKVLHARASELLDSSCLLAPSHNRHLEHPCQGRRLSSAAGRFKLKEAKVLVHFFSGFLLP